MNLEGEWLLNVIWIVWELVDKIVNIECILDVIILIGENFCIVFFIVDGEMIEFLYNGKNLIKEGL